MTIHEKRLPEIEQSLSKEKQALLLAIADLDDNELKKVIEFSGFLRSIRTP